MSAKFEIHFHDKVGQNINNVEHMDVHLDKDGNIQVMNAESIRTPTAPMETPQQVAPQSTPTSIPEEQLFQYIHHDVEDKDIIRTHNAIRRIVKLPKMPQVMEALKELMLDKRIYRTIRQDAMLAELRRLGLPDGSTPGFSDNNFFSAYNALISNLPKD